MGKLKSDYSVYVSFGGTKIRLPVNPEEIEIKYPTSHKTYDVLGKGEIIVPRKPSLNVVSWECFFPGNTGAPYVNGGAKDPERYVKLFRNAWEKKQKCRLIIARSGLYDTNMRCIISDFETTDKGGEPKDVYYSVEFTEYRDYGPKNISAIIASAASSEPVQISAEKEREVETPVLRVGAPVIVNGAYCYDSYGSKPHGTANNLRTTVTRIVTGNPYPVHVGSYGWVQEGQLQIVG